MINFTKMHGCGNDYIYIDNIDRSIDIDEFKSRIPGLCDRHFGVGADGVIFICSSLVADAMMVMFNADGSLGKMCGNGVRCVARYVYEHGICKNNPMYIETLSGIKKLSIEIDGDEFLVCVDMGKYSVKASDIPVICEKDEVVGEVVEDVSITCVSMGNPHVVMFVDDVDNVDILSVGPKWENNPMFPDRINVEFVEVINEDTLKMRVWERGSGETLACGTCACASLVAAILNGYVNRCKDIKVILKGGELVVKCDEDNTVFLKGNAVEVYEGVIDNG